MNAKKCSTPTDEAEEEWKENPAVSHRCYLGALRSHFRLIFFFIREYFGRGEIFDKKKSRCMSEFNFKARKNKNFHAI